ncbi:MAG: hypothetical protein NT169_18850 [Chloroflexi bacterium]|nr:hypothetical protein [Chloroflexota bacterium]
MRRGNASDRPASPTSARTVQVAVAGRVHVVVTYVGAPANRAGNPGNVWSDSNVSN